MTQLSRRDFLRATAAGVGLGAAAGGTLAGCAAPAKGDLARKTGRRVVVIGGGWGGATAAKYVRLQDPSIEVILLEPNRTFVSCPFSNLVLSGVETIERSRSGTTGCGPTGSRSGTRRPPPSSPRPSASASARAIWSTTG